MRVKVTCPFVLGLPPLGLGCVPLAFFPSSQRWILSPTSDPPPPFQAASEAHKGMQLGSKIKERGSERVRDQQQRGISHVPLSRPAFF